MATFTPNRGGEFSNHPDTENPVKAVVADITDLKMVSGKYGDALKFQVVFESELKDEKGKNYGVWTPPMTPSISEKANFPKLFKQVRGRAFDEKQDLNADGNLDMDALLLGRSVWLMIEQTTSGDKTYSNIVSCYPDKSDNPFKGSGKFVRAQDRDKARMAGASKSSAEEEREHWQQVKIHVGAKKGRVLGDLDDDALQKLWDNWLPRFKADPKPTADDKRLAAGLEAAMNENKAPADEDEYHPF